MRRIRTGLRWRRGPPAPVLPESMTGFVSEPGAFTAPLWDIALALLAGVVVALACGWILHAW